jgi:long-chain fatty acid transport protein
MGVKTALWGVLFFFLIFLVGRNSFAGGFYIPHQTARGLGLSNALTAGVNDPSAVYYNPAALSEVEGNQILFTGTYVELIASVENSGDRAINSHPHNFLGSLFGNYHIKGTDITVGLGAYAPFGLATSYGGDFQRFAARETQLKTMYITPAVSWSPSKFFSIGGGVSFIHSSAVLGRSFCVDPITGCTGPTLFPREERIRITGTDNTYSYNVGILLKPIDKVKIGFSYRGSADLQYDNAHSKLSGDFGRWRTQTSVRPIRLPAIMNVGLFWQINPAWGAELVYEYQHWSVLKDIRARFSNPPFGFFPGSFTLTESWKNSNTVRLGSFYRITKNLELRGGIAVEESPIPDRTLNPAIPGANLLTLNGGLGYKWEKFFVDLGYQAVFYKTRRVSNSELEGGSAPGFPFTGAPGKDKYKTFNNFVSVSLGYGF